MILKLFPFSKSCSQVSHLTIKDLKIIQSFYKFRDLTHWCCYPVIWQHTDSRLTVMPDRSFPLLNLALEPLNFLRANKLALVSVILEMT